MIFPWFSSQDIRVPFDLMAQDPRTEDPRNQDLKDFAKVDTVEDPREKENEFLLGRNDGF